MLESQDLHVQAFPGVACVPRQSWDALFDNAIGGWAFCKAGEAAPPAGFDLSAIGVYRGTELVAAAQVFHTSHRLDMSLPAPLRACGEWVFRHAPTFIDLPVMGIGSPLADRCHVGFARRLSPGERAQVWQSLLEGFEREARDRGAHVFVVKDLGDDDLAWAQPALGRAHFAALSSLPVAVLDLPFARIEDYLANLSSRMRSDLRRKLRQAAGKVRFEVCESCSGLSRQLGTLYESTRARRRAYDALSPDYLDSTLQALGQNARLTLAWIGEELASFDLCLIAPDRVIAHQIGMRYPLARKYNLYFLNWMRVVHFCIDRGVRRLEMGQTAYLQKRRLGCRLEKSWIYFKHWCRPINGIMRVAAPLAAFNKMEPGAV